MDVSETSALEMARQQIRRHHAELDASHEAAPLLEDIAHRCPICKKPIDLELRGEELPEEMAGMIAKLAQFVHCDACCHFQKAKAENLEAMGRANGRLYALGVKGDAFRARMKRIDDQDEQAEIVQKLQGLELEADECRATIEITERKLYELEATLREYIDKKTEPRETKFDDVPF